MQEAMKFIFHNLTKKIILSLIPVLFQLNKSNQLLTKQKYIFFGDAAEKN